MGKKIISITCPYCGREYLPAEIYIPKSFMGRPVDIEKTQEGKIDNFSGPLMDTTEEYICDGCGETFQVKASISFRTFKKDTDTPFVAPLKPQKISLFEE